MDKKIIIDDRYELIRAIDGGGTSHIVLANDLKEEKQVCLKILRTEHIDDDMYTSAFNAEIELLSGLDHEGIIKILDSGRQGNVLYYVMDVIKGHTLKRLIEQGVLSLEDKVNICLSVCDIMQYSHNHGVLHKDLKSANIMVKDDGGVVVLDFGTEGEARNEDAEILGTVEYFSPEQALGESLDEYSDIYSMGVLMYELFTGRLPFDGKDNIQIALKQVHQYPDDPSVVNGDIPESINRIIKKTMRKDKAERYSSFKTLLKDLSRSLDRPDGRYIREFDIKEENKENSTKNSKFIIFGIVGIIITLLTVSALVFFGVFSGSQKDYFMPSLENRNVSELDEIKKEYRFSITFRYETDEALDDGVIISQTPEAGTKIKKGESIILVVNSNRKEPVVMPEAVGHTLEEAIGMFTELGVPYENIEISYVQNQSYADETVVDQYPDSDETFSVNDGVVLYVNNLGSLKANGIPDLTGLDIEAAVKQSRENGFNHVFITYIENTEMNSGTVAAQYPTPDIVDYSGDSIELTVVKAGKDVRARKYSLDGLAIEAVEDDKVTVVVEYEAEGTVYEFIIDKFTVKEDDHNLKDISDGKDYLFEIDSELYENSCVLRVYVNGNEIYFINMLNGTEN